MRYRTDRLAGINRRFKRELSWKEARRRAGKGRPSTRQVAEAMVATERRYLVATLLRSGMGYRWVTDEVNRQGFSVTLATVYADAMQVFGELKEATRETIADYANRLLAQSENVKVHMTARMRKGDTAAAGRILQALEFEARIRGAYAPIRVRPVDPEDERERPFEGMSDEQLQVELDGARKLLTAPPSQAQPDVVDAEVVETQLDGGE